MGRILTFLAIPVCAALIGYMVVYGLWVWVGGEPPSWGGIVYGAVFVVLSLVVVWVSLNAWRQDRRSGARMGGWVVIPVLVLVGAGAGAALAASHGAERLKIMASYDSDTCERLLGEEAPAGAVDECVPLAHACRRETAGRELPLGARVEGLPPGVEPYDTEQALVMQCLVERR